MEWYIWLNIDVKKAYLKAFRRTIGATFDTANVWLLRFRMYALIFKTLDLSRNLNIQESVNNRSGGLGDFKTSLVDSIVADA
jgi:hypothetical protein